MIRSYGLLVLASVWLTAMGIVYVISGVPPSALSEFLLTYAMPILIAIWITADARRRHRTPCFDFGLFLMWFFPVVAPGYLIWTRGWRGIFVTVALYPLIFVPTVAVGLAISLPRLDGP